jgi:predicted small secreted protein
MKKIVLSFAAVALLAGLVAGCAKTEEKPVAKIVRKG